MTEYKLTRDKFLTEEEQQKLIDTLNREHGTRDQLLITLLLATGCRASELLLIENTDLDDKTRSVFIVGLKGSNDRTVPLEKRLYSQLKAYAARVREPGEDAKKVFSIKLRRLEDIWAKFRPVNKKLHSLRHTFAVNMYKQTKDIYLVKTWLGHRSLTNTMIYMDHVDSIEALRKSMPRLGVG